jgi:chloramphenicol-sensitive protein RarD
MDNAVNTHCFCVVLHIEGEDKMNMQQKGAWYAGSAYVMWGVLPLYWKLLQHVPSEIILAHRVIWSFVFMMGIMVFKQQFHALWVSCRNLAAQPKLLLLLVTASFLISINWFIYIWAVNHNHIIEASLGYYINPLVSILLGMVVLKERLTLWQIISVLCAATGVSILTLLYGAFPWIALCLAVSFGIYGLVKKVIALDAAVGLTIETLLIAPVALIYVMLPHTNTGVIEWHDLLLLAGGGVATALPLLYFAKGAKLISLSMIGFLQYIAPSISLGIGVFLYNERFTHAHMIAFSFIWIALLIFSFANTKLMRRLRPNTRKDKAV